MDRRIQKTRESIKQAYFKLLKQNNRITVSEIAREANIDRKTFYLHYSCVDDVWNTFCDEKVEELFDRLKKKGFLENPIQMKVFFETMNEVFEENRESLRLLSNSLYHSFWNRIHTILVQAIILVYADKVNVSKENMKVYCDFFIAGLIRLYQDYLTNASELSTEQIEKIVMEIAMSGISNIIINNA